MSTSFTLRLIALAAAFVVSTSMALNAAPNGQPELPPKVAAALDSKATIEFRKTPLVDAIKFLSLKHGVPIVLAPKVNPQLTITFSVKGVKFAEALSTMLKAQELTWEVKDGGILVTPLKKT